MSFSGGQRTRLGTFGATRAPYGSFAGRAPAPVIVQTTPTETLGGGHWPNEDEIVHWLRTLFPRPTQAKPVSARAAKQQAKRKPERVIADAREWAAQPDEAIASLIRESIDLKKLAAVRRDYEIALKQFKRQQQNEAIEAARKIVMAYLKRQQDDDEAMKLILEFI